MTPRPAVLFDLDGTLLDTAPDMVPALNHLRAEQGLAPLPFAAVRPYVSNGSAGLVRIGFPGATDADLAMLQARYLEIYAAALLRETVLFPGLDALLATLEARGVPWGVVTNKPAHLTEPLLDGLGLRTRAACVVSGDTLPARKPDPRPVRHAIEQVRASAAHTLYVGDAERDIVAGRGAGARTVAVEYGYIAPGDRADRWGADTVVPSVAELARSVIRLLP